MRRTKSNYTEEAFLLSNFSEFIKCWKSSKRSRLYIESVNGSAFVNFSAFLGNPSEAHSPHSTPYPQRRHPSSEGSKKKKSPRKIQRDNERAAKFQERKRTEQAAASSASGSPPPPTPTPNETRKDEQAVSLSASGEPPQTSSPAESSVRAASVNFSFASPVAEDRTNNAMEGISDPQLSLEDLRQELEDPPSLSREDQAKPICENSTISQEVRQESQETASKRGKIQWPDGVRDSASKRMELFKMLQELERQSNKMAAINAAFNQT